MVLWSLMAWPRQIFQQFFAGASNFTITGGQFNAIAGNYVVNNGTGLDKAEEMYIGQRQVERMMLEVQRKVIAECHIPCQVGYGPGNGVVIIDAFGRELVLPPTIVALYSDAHVIVSNHFRGKLGEERVAQFKYCIVTKRHGVVVGPHNWARALEKGEIFVMCMLIEEEWVESLKEACPKCGKTSLGTMKDGGFLVCRRCEKHFTHTNRPEWTTWAPMTTNVDSFKHFLEITGIVPFLLQTAFEVCDYVTPSELCKATADLLVALLFREVTTNGSAVLLSSLKYVTPSELCKATADLLVALLFRNE
ncbi:hypothetical protein NMY22_g17316 [Coprinellus aureogranulatus]|nr:hypothetical protein NMY22_g17316 [Coprinellus aureogranulatus]